MTWSPKRKAAALSIALLTVSVAFVATAAATTGGTLSPLLAGNDHPHERPLTRQAIGLGVIVAAVTEGGVQNVHGAGVTLFQVAPGDGGERRLAHEETNERGQAVFQLRPGAYRIHVEWRGHGADEVFRLQDSTRMGVVFDEDGQAHWRMASQRSMERHGDTHALAIRAMATGDGERGPAQGATVHVYRLVRGEDGPEREPVHRGVTDEGGLAVFHLHRGTYLVSVTHEGETLSQRVALDGPARLAFAFGR